MAKAKRKRNKPKGWLLCVSVLCRSLLAAFVRWLAALHLLTFFILSFKINSGKKPIIFPSDDFRNHADVATEHNKRSSNEALALQR
jgi:hypothetical protein